MAFVHGHFLHSHLDFCSENLGDESDEHGERFHQQMKVMETRYQGLRNEAMIDDYCWFLIRETKSNCKRQKKTDLSHF